jgi:hypothetical protein
LATFFDQAKKVKVALKEAVFLKWIKVSIIQ